MVLPTFKIREKKLASPLRLFTEKEKHDAIMEIFRMVKELLPKLIPDPIQGENGEIGLNGIDGVNGQDGIKGAIGKVGKNGKDGVDGERGQDGQDGVSPELPDFEEMLKPELEKIRREVGRRQAPAKAGGGGDSMRFRAVTSDTVMAVNDKLMLVDATSADITITLPAASQGARREYHIKKVDSTANTVTIQPQGSVKIDGETTVVINFENTNCRLYSNGVNWFQL